MSSEYSVLTNMYFNHQVQHSEDAMIKAGDYFIEFKREDVEKTFFDVQFQYRCNIIFKDLTGREVRRLVINEFQAMQLLDGINAYVYDNEFLEESYLLSNVNGPTIYETYTLCLMAIIRDDEDPNNNVFEIVLKRYNDVLGVLDDVLTIRLTLNELDSFVDTAFFIFLIDIASERNGIFQV